MLVTLRVLKVNNVLFLHHKDIIRVPFCAPYILTSFVIYYGTDTRQHGTDLAVITKVYLRIFCYRSVKNQFQCLTERSPMWVMGVARLKQHPL